MMLSFKDICIIINANSSIHDDANILKHYHHFGMFCTTGSGSDFEIFTGFKINNLTGRIRFPDIRPGLIWI